MDDVEKLQDFETFHLERLTVFLSVPDWNPKSSSTKTFEQEVMDLERTQLNSTTIAVNNPRSQLGLLSSSSSQSGGFFSKFIPNFPIFKVVLQRTFWGNRNVLEVSLHIDNVLALTAGFHYSSMAEKKRDTEDKTTDALKGLGISNMDDIYAHEQGALVENNADGQNSRTETIRISPDFSPDEELFMYQLVSDDSEFTMLQRRFAFLGCGMEALRSSLATWVDLNPNVAESVWKPCLYKDGRNRVRTFSFRASNSLARCMKANDWGELLGGRYIQMRLLWELQSYFLYALPEEGISPERHEAIVLCLLSFPDLQCTKYQAEENTEFSSVNTGDGVSVAYIKERRMVMCVFLYLMDLNQFKLWCSFELVKTMKSRSLRHFVGKVNSLGKAGETILHLALLQRVIGSNRTASNILLW